MRPSLNKHTTSTLDPTTTNESPTTTPSPVVPTYLLQTRPRGYLMIRSPDPTLTAALPSSERDDAPLYLLLPRPTPTSAIELCIVRIRIGAWGVEPIRPCPASMEHPRDWGGFSRWVVFRLLAAIFGLGIQKKRVLLRRMRVRASVMPLVC